MDIIHSGEPGSEKKQIREAEAGENKTKRNHAKEYVRLKTSSLIGIIILTILLASLFGAVFGFISGGAAGIFSSRIEQKVNQYFPNLISKSADTAVSKQQVIIEDSAVIDVVEKSSPAVVSIIISKDVAINNPQDFFNNFFDPFSGGGSGLAPSPQSDQGGTTQQQVGGGSGFFITANGLILTNRHVVEDPQASYTVVTNDGKQYPAKILARDPVRDTAVMKIEGNEFPVLAMGDSDSLKIGQTTIAIGNSLGEFSNSVSRGIVSGLRRNVNAESGFGDTERLTDIIQTDAAINPGNSGGPLIDIQGNVVGINVAMAQGAQNIGFALPINQAKRIIDEAESGVKIQVPFLGVRYIVIDPAVQREAQLPFDYGVLVLRGNRMTDLAVIPGSPADKAGVVENDIILEINNQKVTSDNQLGDIVAKYNVGDKVTLKIWHRGQTKDVQVTLEERKQ